MAKIHFFCLFSLAALVTHFLLLFIVGVALLKFHSAFSLLFQVFFCFCAASTVQFTWDLKNRFLCEKKRNKTATTTTKKRKENELAKRICHSSRNFEYGKAFLVQYSSWELVFFLFSSYYFFSNGIEQL